MTTDDESTARRQQLWTSVIAVCTAAVVALPVTWNFRFDPLRQATESGLYGNFFDLQAEALLNGRLDVPAGSLGIEAFVVDGKEYLYFGPWPAILRLPLRALTDRWWGELTAWSLLLAWLVLAVCVCALVFRVRRAISGHRELMRSERWWWGGLIVVVLAGSPVLLLLAVPWVFAEALLWAAAGTTAVLAAALGVLARPGARPIVLLGLATLIAALSRVTAAWPAALIVLLVAVVNARRQPLGAMRGHVIATAAAGLVPLALGVAVNMAKFDQPVGIPFQDQVWTDVSDRRQQVIDEGGVVSSRFLPTTLVAYGRPDGLRFTSTFPFITAPARPPGRVGDVTLEMSYRTQSVPASMPALVVLGVMGAAAVLRRRVPTGVADVRVPMAGALLVPGGALLVGYLAPRYLVEFVPFFAVAGAVGLAALLDRPVGRTRRILLAAVSALAAFGLMVNLAGAIWTANVRTAGGALQQLVSTQLSVARLPGAGAPTVILGDRPPRRSDPDTVFVSDRCVTAYYGTADNYEPWMPIWTPDVTIDIAAGERRDRARTLALVEFEQTTLTLELDGEGSYRLSAPGADRGITGGDWYPLSEPARIRVTGRSDWNEYLIDAPGHLYAALASVETFGDDVRVRPLPPLVVADEEAADAAGADVTVAIERPGLCDELLDQAGR